MSGNEIHDAYMKGLFDGEKRILDLVVSLVEDARVEREKQMEAQE